jgi:cytochrome c-type biogenesis protein CcmH
MAPEAADAEVRARAALAGRPEALAAFEAGMAATAGTPRAAPAGGEPATRGPSAEDMAAAGAMSAEDRAAMVQGMVGGLRDRLYAQGGPAEQWAQLIRSLGVLGDRDGAAEALTKAREAHAADPVALALIEETARQAGAGAP